MITGEGFLTNLWDSHHGGRWILLSMRAERQESNRPAWNLFRVMHTLLIIGCLITKTPPPEDCVQWLRTSSYNGPIEKQCILIVEVVQLVACVENVTSSWPEPLRTQKLYQILEQGKGIDQRLVLWADSLPSVWRYTSVPNKSTSTTIPKSIHIHEDLFAAAVWNSWRAVRIRLVQTLMAVTELLGEDTSDTDFRSVTRRKTILDLAEDICCSTPYLLGEIDGQGIPRGTAKGVALGGYTLMYPLRIICTVNELPESIHDWVEIKLTYIADVLGIGQANLLVKLNKLRNHFPVIGDNIAEAMRIIPYLKCNKQYPSLEKEPLVSSQTPS